MLCNQHEIAYTAVVNTLAPFCGQFVIQYVLLMVVTQGSPPIELHATAVSLSVHESVRFHRRLHSPPMACRSFTVATSVPQSATVHTTLSNRIKR